MKKFFLGGAAAGVLTAAALGFATASNADPADKVAGAVLFESQRISWNEIRIVTDDYLVPAYVCPDPDAEKYEDCVPRSRVGQYAVLVLPAKE